jgi:hypothetical protein
MLYLSTNFETRYLLSSCSNQSIDKKFLFSSQFMLKVASSVFRNRWWNNKNSVFLCQGLALKLDPSLQGCHTDFNRFHSITIFQESVLDLKNTGGNVLVTDDSLILRHVTEQQEGSYRCVAKNQVGSGASNVIELTVKCKST